jgi:hypothetical protein
MENNVKKRIRTLKNMMEKNVTSPDLASLVQQIALEILVGDATTAADETSPKSAVVETSPECEGHEETPCVLTD